MTRLARLYLRHTLVVLIAFVLLTSQIALADDQAKKPPKYTIDPQRIARGQRHEVIVQTNPPSDLSGVTVAARAGSLIFVDKQSLIDDNQGLLVELDVRGNCSLGPTQLLITDAKKNLYSVNFNIIDTERLPQQPTPTGKSEVDAAWMVQPDIITKGNFGRWVSNNFFCVKVTIGNNSGYDLEIRDVFFEAQLEKAANSEKVAIPGDNHTMVKGMIEKGAQNGRRNIIINAVISFGGILTGLSPFFENLRPKAHYETFSNVFNGGFSNGLQKVLPDTTIREMARLNEDGFQRSIIIPNNTPVAITIFVPKDTFEWGSGEKTKPWLVMKRLGQLSLVAQRIEFLQREIVIGRPASGPGQNQQNPADLSPNTTPPNNSTPAAKPEEKKSPQSPASAPPSTPAAPTKPAEKPPAPGGTTVITVSPPTAPPAKPEEKKPPTQ